MEPTNIPMSMVRGDTLGFDITLSNLGSATVTSLVFSAKQNPKASEYAFHKAIGDGIEHLEGNTYHVRVAPNDTADLTPGKYSYDIQVGLDSDIYTPVMGTLTIRQDVTEGGNNG